MIEDIKKPSFGTVFCYIEDVLFVLTPQMPPAAPERASSIIFPGDVKWPDMSRESADMRTYRAMPQDSPSFSPCLRRNFPQIQPEKNPPRHRSSTAIYLTKIISRSRKNVTPAIAKEAVIRIIMPDRAETVILNGKDVHKL